MLFLLKNLNQLLIICILNTKTKKTTKFTSKSKLDYIDPGTKGYLPYKDYYGKFSNCILKKVVTKYIR